MKKGWKSETNKKGQENKKIDTRQNKIYGQYDKLCTTKWESNCVQTKKKSAKNQNNQE